MILVDISEKVWDWWEKRKTEKKKRALYDKLHKYDGAKYNQKEMGKLIKQIKSENKSKK